MAGSANWVEQNWDWDQPHYMTGPNSLPLNRKEWKHSHSSEECSRAPPNWNNQHSSLLQERNTTGWFLHVIMGCVVYYYYIVNTGRGSLLGFISTQFTSGEISVIQSELLQKTRPEPWRALRRSDLHDSFFNKYWSSEVRLVIIISLSSRTKHAETIRLHGNIRY